MTWLDSLVSTSAASRGGRSWRECAGLSFCERVLFVHPDRILPTIDSIGPERLFLVNTIMLVFGEFFCQVVVGDSHIYISGGMATLFPRFAL